MTNVNVKELADMLALKALNESDLFPVDRLFLQQYLDKILAVDRNEFILYNLEKANNTYTVQLFLCLPEIWEDVEVNDMIAIVSEIKNVFSFFALITFTYKYIEINIIDLLLSLPTISIEFKKEIKDYLKSQYPNFLKANSDYFFLETGLYGIKIDDWKYVKQRLLLDNRITPALERISELESYIFNII